MKIVFLILGIFSFILGLIGIIIPLLPTTPFLLFALYCFTRSSKTFEEKFRNSKIYEKYLSDFVKNRQLTLGRKTFIVSLATVMLLFPFVILNSIIVRILIISLIIFIYYYFFTKIKTTRKNFSEEIENMLDQKVIEIVKSTAPILKERGVEITTKFYEILFKNNPEVKTLFSEEKQKSGAQPKALAMSILAAAQNIDNLEAILPTVQKIGEVHVNAKVIPEQYPIVGKNLLIAFKEVLGDAINDEVLDAWAKAYEVISKVFIDVENNIRK